ncbi:hypothetical protein SDC9_162544 [bioreactor metagenome]|uniref:Uncharacterized protein n=1 Tax=bioreactor metagenome TaxID=1076179 RepID=A0A645FLD9_9ZZZZ
MESRGDQTGDMGHIHEEIGARLMRDFAEGLKIDDARIGGSARQDHFRLMLFGQIPNLIIVDTVGDRVHSVGHDIVVETGEIHRAAVGQVAAVGEIHAENGISQVAQCLIDRIVCLRAAVGLNVDMVGAEDLFGAVSRDVLHHVHALAAAVVPFSGVTFGVFIGQNGGSCGHNGLAHKIFRCDQFNVSPLPVVLRSDSLPYLRIPYA